MKFILFLTLLLPLNIYAQEEVCHHDHGLVGEELEQLLEWFGARDKQITEAPCKVKKIPSEKEMLSYIGQKAGSKKTPSKTVRGVTFKNESPALIEAFQEFTTLFDSMGILERDQDKQKNFQEDYKINPECEKVVCALSKIWGENGTKMLYIKLKHNYNTSELSFDNSTRFTPQELNDVLIGLEDIPEHLTPIGRKNQRLTRFSEGYTLKNYGPGVVANAVVMLFDRWKEDTSPSKQYTIFHEVAHNMASKLNGLDNDKEWLDQSGWVKKGEEWSSAKDACFTSEYGTTNPAEDFAETATTYRYNGKTLKENCPKKFEFMKTKVFKGVDYSSEALCSPVTKEQLSFVRKQVGKDLFTLLGPQEYDSKLISENCSQHFTSYPLDNKETAACALDIQLKTNLRKNIKRAMEQVGIEDTGYQEEMLLKTLNKDIRSDETYIETILKKTSPLSQQVDKLVEAELKKMRETPIDSAKIEMAWSMASRKCGTLLLTSSEQEIEKCYTADILAQDTSNRSWGQGFLPSFELPRIFSSEAQKSFDTIREEIILKMIKGNAKLAEKKKELKKDFSFSLERHFRDTSKTLKEIPKWKELSPKEFCEATYGKSTIWLSSFGFKSGETSDLLIQKCQEIQSQKEKRFELNSSHVKAIVN